MSKETEIGLLLKILGGDAGLQVIPGSVDTGRLIRLAERHRVVYHLRQFAHEHTRVFSDEQIAGLNKRCHEGALRSLNQLRELKRIAGAMNERGIGYVCIKGPQLSRMIYGREALKESVDLDFILVNAGDLLEAHAVLTELGYTFSNLNEYRKRLNRKLFLIAKREVYYYNRDNRSAIDLHIRPGSNTYLTAGLFRGFLSPLSASDLDGTPVPVLPDEAYFAYLCYHGALHQFSRLAWLMDIRAFLQLKRGTLDYNRLLEIAYSLHAERHLFLALRLLEEYFNDEIPEPLSKLVIRSPRIHFLASNCRSMIGRDTSYGLSLKGRFGKLLYMMVLLRGWTGKVDWIYGIIMRMLVGMIRKNNLKHP
jgi:hypothetical protein